MRAQIHPLWRKSMITSARTSSFMVGLAPAFGHATSVGPETVVIANGFEGKSLVSQSITALFA
jgi:hypothetical protein